MMPKKESWNDRIRDAITGTGLPLYRIAKWAGLSIGPLQRFMNEEHGLTVASLEAIAPYVGLELRRVKPKKGTEDGISLDTW